ncbi:MAG TPA: peptide deformylase [Niabella sp.]|nr:peptide deformylase [Niabella sp.]HOZ96533.1 peptide deformylase [Niabella sp.]HQW13286.1 peptide deformylase [Niabella sp.]HQX18674.1 peptide deformylase [Niabella sp.]HQX40327.1 peptide deformylase [Niabella sp.]
MKLFFFISISLLYTHSLQAQNFSEGEKEIILSGDTSTMLRVIPLSEPVGQKALRTISLDIAFDDPLLTTLKNRMLKAVQDPANRGVGIAAPQVGINRNLIWVQRFDKKEQPFEFFINPKIIWRSDFLLQGVEGDLSFQDRDDVIRNYAIMVSYIDTTGRQQIEMMEEFTSIIFQHETDHLSGILFTDRVADQKNKRYAPFQPKRAKALLREIK